MIDNNDNTESYFDIRAIVDAVLYSGIDSVLPTDIPVGSPPIADVAASEIPDVTSIIEEDRIDDLYASLRARKRGLRFISRDDNQNMEDDLSNVGLNEGINGIHQNGIHQNGPVTHEFKCNDNIDYLRCYNYQSYHSRLAYDTQSVLNLELLSDLHNIHDGCVNRLAWSFDGTRLASVSDDCKLCVSSLSSLYLGNNVSPPVKIDTEHYANIFGVCFVDNDSHIATGAMDDQVRLHQLTPTGSTLNKAFSCHSQRVKEVVSIPGPLWWTCSEDGTIRQFDTRLRHDCGDTARGCSNILVGAESDFRYNVSALRNPPIRGNIPLPSYWRRKRFTSSIHEFNCSPGNPPRVPQTSEINQFGTVSWKSIALNPVRTEYLLAAGDDPLIRVYDRRMLRLSSSSQASTLTPPASLPCETYFPLQLSLAPRRLAAEVFFADRLHPTHVDWSPDGRAFLASYSIGDIYVFPFNSCRTDDTAELRLSIPRIDDPSLNFANTEKRHLNNDTWPSTMENQDNNIITEKDNLTEKPSKMIEDSLAINFIDVLPEFISDELVTVTQDYLTVGCRSTAEFISDDLNSQHHLYKIIHRLQQKGNDYMKSCKYSDAIVSYTAALRLCGPPWPVRVMPPDTQSQQSCSNAPISFNHPVTNETITAGSSTNNMNDCLLDCSKRKAVVLDQTIASLRLPLLCNRSLALTKRGGSCDTYQAETDALEALSYDPMNQKAGYRLLQAYETRNWCDPNELRRAMFVIQRMRHCLDNCPKFLSKLETRFRPNVKLDYFRLTKVKDDPLGEHRTSLLSVGLSVFNNYRQSIPWWIGFRKTITERLNSSTENVGSDDDGCDEDPDQANSMNDEIQGECEDNHIEDQSSRSPERSLKRCRQLENQIINNTSDGLVHHDYYDLIDDPYWQPRLIADRLYGRQNQLTDIQEASFYGNQFVVSGSDFPYIVIWRRIDGAIVKVLNTNHRKGINCVQPHPHSGLLASSGLGHNIQIWHPYSST